MSSGDRGLVMIVRVRRYTRPLLGEEGERRSHRGLLKNFAHTIRSQEWPNTIYRCATLHVDHPVWNPSLLDHRAAHSLPPCVYIPVARTLLASGDQVYTRARWLSSY
jgi:hypothetical protein